MALHVAGGWTGMPSFAAEVCYLLAMLAGLWLVLPKAWVALRRLRPDMNMLMVVAIAGAVVIGEWAEAATVALLFALSLELEAWSVGRVRRAVTALLDLAPPTSRVIVDGVERDVPAKDVAVGAVFVVRPGERVPLDGTVKATSHVNQAPITGESVPAPKQPCDEVFAGTINGEGVLEVTVTRAVNDTTLARIIRMVGESQSGVQLPSGGSISSPLSTPRRSWPSRWPWPSSRRCSSAAGGRSGCTGRWCCSSSPARVRW